MGVVGLTGRAKVVYGLTGALVVIAFYFLLATYAPEHIPHPPNPLPPLAAHMEASALAPRLNPADLIARPITTDVQTLPKIFHQSWKTSDAPDWAEQWVEKCRRVHKDWHWVLWSNEDNQKLVETHFPWLLEVYNAFPADIYRADLARNLYMNLYGGVYADLDMECLRPHKVVFDAYNTTTIPYSAVPRSPASTKPGWDTRRAFFARMGLDNNFIDSIPNAWMASTPGHPFFLIPLQYVLDRFKEDPTVVGSRVESLTGPDALRNAITRYHAEFGSAGPKVDEYAQASPLHQLYPFGQGLPHSVEILPHQIIFPYSHTNQDDMRPICWARESTYDQERCKKELHVNLQGSVMITYWAHSWKRR